MVSKLSSTTRIGTLLGLLYSGVIRECFNNGGSIHADCNKTLIALIPRGGHRVVSIRIRVR